MKKVLKINEDSWIKNGLRFQCNQCGKCCRGEPGVVWIVNNDILNISAYLKMTVEEFSKNYLRNISSRFSLIEMVNGDCVMYDNGCKIYPVRPRQCRTFPFWITNISLKDEWDALINNCPGINKGKLYSFEDIIELVSMKNETK